MSRGRNVISVIALRLDGSPSQEQQSLVRTLLAGTALARTAPSYTSRFDLWSDCPLPRTSSTLPRACSQVQPKQPTAASGDVFAPKPCHFFLMGTCTKGAACRYPHIVDTSTVEPLAGLDEYGPGLVHEPTQPTLAPHAPSAAPTTAFVHFMATESHQQQQQQPPAIFEDAVDRPAIQTARARKQPRLEEPPRTHGDDESSRPAVTVAPVAPSRTAGRSVGDAAASPATVTPLPPPTVVVPSGGSQRLGLGGRAHIAGDPLGSQQHESPAPSQTGKNGSR